MNTIITFICNRIILLMTMISINRYLELLSTILANYVLDEMIKESLSNIPFHLPFMKEFVDDQLLAVPMMQIREPRMVLDYSCSFKRNFTNISDNVE